ncbi:MAG TPA: RNA-binding S4 domain-containing protein [Candidatus Melainabacteria bacterium]|jgi:ribosome-associated protein|nr:RNA-binding S4 domain-containing protein [Candidatus Melainabacteria bacterium]
MIADKNKEDDSSFVIQLDQFLKLKGVTQSGGEAKHLIQSGEVKVNGSIDTRRKKKLGRGDVVEVHDKKYVVDESVV